ncbi:MAG: toll/interleukin-1 receptor domain-containing protein [Isosphaeraceae bacterium]
MDYEFDFFLSYPSRAAAGRWVLNHFYPVLKEELESEDAGSAVFCWTENKEEAGSLWDERIKKAHARSRLLIAVLTPPYFYKSRWCQAEWDTMIQRQKCAGLGVSVDQSLICPVLYSDGENHPAEAQRISYFDFRDWAIPDPVFKDTPDFVQFRRDVRKFAKVILKRRSLAPPWSDTWPVLEPGVLSTPRATLPRL